MKAQATQQKDAQGFTLVEMLVVLVIVAAMLALTMPAWFSLSSSMSLSQAGGSLADVLANARQSAIANNTPVEVRFFDEETIEDDLVVKKVGLLQQLPDGSYEGLPFFQLPAGIGISRDPKYTSFFSSDDNAEFLIRGEEDKDSYVGFRFRPDGETELPNGKWFLTVIPEQIATLETDEVLRNFVTIQIDPVMGRVRVFRP